VREKSLIDNNTCYVMFRYRTKEQEEAQVDKVKTKTIIAGDLALECLNWRKIP